MQALRLKSISISEEMEGKKAKEKISWLLDSMSSEFSPSAIGLALEGLLLDLCFDEFEKNEAAAEWAKSFIPAVAYNFFRLEQDIQTGEEFADAEKRNRDAGGTGTPFQ